MCHTHNRKRDICVCVNKHKLHHIHVIIADQVFAHSALAEELPTAVFTEQNIPSANNQSKNLPQELQFHSMTEEATCHFKTLQQLNYNSSIRMSTLLCT